MHVYVRPFQVKGATVNVAVTAASQALAITRPGVGTQSVRIANIGTQTIFIVFGISTATATVAAGMPMLANTAETFTIENEVTTVAVIAGNTGSTMYVTTGESA
jgi:hypothetical protein